MPHFAYTGDIKNVECAICLEPWTDAVEVAPCRHVFCRRCVGGLTTCPDCRAQIQQLAEANRILVNIANEAKCRCETCGWSGIHENRGGHDCASVTASAASASTATAAQATALNPVDVYYLPGDHFSGQPPSGGTMPWNSNDGFGQHPPPSTAQPPPRAPQEPAPYSPQLEGYHGAGGPPTGPWSEYGLKQEEYDHIMAIFMTFDEDGSGELDRGELTTLCRWLNFANTPEQIEAMFREMDTDRSGSLSLHEFCQWSSTHRPDPSRLYGLAEDEYHHVLFQFHKFDRDNNGYLDAHEFAGLAQRVGYARTSQEAQMVFRDIDTDRSGSVDIHELLTYRARMAGHNVAPRF